MEQILIGVGIGIALTLFIGWIVRLFRCDGVLVVDDSNEFKTNWQLIVKTDPEKVPKKRSIRLQVHVQK